MNTPTSDKIVSPGAVLKQVADAVPGDFHKNIIIVGSLAAGYYFFGDKPELQVRTKDVDCLISPRIQAIHAGKAVTDGLFARKWQLRSEGQWGKPGDDSTPPNELPVVRLHPPGSTEWFIELLTGPESESDLGREDIRLVTSQGHFNLCSFGFLSLAEFEPVATPFGIAIALPETMALANLLHHPTIGKQTMSSLIGGRSIKRGNKDLGRVLALAYLAEVRKEDSVQKWPAVWTAALQSRFPTTWRKLASQIGGGLRQLLSRKHMPGLEEAGHTCANGLLVSQPPTLALLRATGQRLLQDAVEPLEKLSSQ